MLLVHQRPLWLEERIRCPCMYYLSSSFLLVCIGWIHVFPYSLMCFTCRWMTNLLLLEVTIGSCFNFILGIPGMACVPFICDWLWKRGQTCRSQHSKIIDTGASGELSIGVEPLIHDYPRDRPPLFWRPHFSGLICPLEACVWSWTLLFWPWVLESFYFLFSDPFLWVFLGGLSFLTAF